MPVARTITRRRRGFAPDPRVNRTPNHPIYDGMAASAMAGGGETYFTAFALFLRATMGVECFSDLHVHPSDHRRVFSAPHPGNRTGPASHYHPRFSFRVSRFNALMRLVYDLVSVAPRERKTAGDTETGKLK